ncbi:hypothetical protein ET445_05410 [Agromyces protaetiae]|uniref:X-X-X-Leu-X-X-Gly heptad repeat-containing protein n=2 Tax=Agromyces protaetiae TaxID=2509455 RepID=A0A4P6FA83_9MICO|nr:hypothetical protein ET445_05410 [Agromyces protaetiae]
MGMPRFYRARAAPRSGVSKGRPHLGFRCRVQRYPSEIYGGIPQSDRPGAACCVRVNTELPSGFFQRDIPLLHSLRSRVRVFLTLRQQDSRTPHYPTRRTATARGIPSPRLHAGHPLECSMTRSTHAHGLGMRIAVIVLSTLLAAMVFLYVVTTSKIADGAAKLSAGTTQVDDGSKDVSDGAGQLAAGAEDLSAGAAKLDKGASDANDGATKLVTGSASAASGAASLDAGAQSLAAGALSAADGAANLAAGAQQLYDEGALKIADGANAAAAGASDLAAKTGDFTAGVVGANGIIVDQLIPGAKSLNDELAAAATSDDVKAAAANGALLAKTATEAQEHAEMLKALVAGLSTTQAPDATTVATIQALANGLEQEVDGMAAPTSKAGELAQGLINASAGAGLVYGGLNILASGDGDKWPGTKYLASDPVAPALAGGAEFLKGKLGELSAGAGSLATKTQSLVDGAWSLNSGVQSLQSGSANLSAGATNLATGTTSLSAGASSLASGLATLSKGAADLNEGTGTLVDGSAELAAGSGDLSDGTAQLVDGAAQLEAGASGTVPSLLPFGLGILLAGLIAIGLWIGHRVNHRARLANAGSVVTA